MRNPRMNHKPAIGFGIAAIVAVLCLAALASDSARLEKPAAVDAEQYADFIENKVFDIQDLAEGAEIQRRRFNRMTPPGFSWVQPMFPVVVPFDAENFDEKLLDELLGEDKNSVAIYPLSLALDPKTRETLVFNAEGKLIATIPADRVSREWPEDADPSRVILQLDLLPAEDVEPYLYTESRIANYSETLTAKATKSGGMVLRSLGASEFGIAGVQRLTNGSMRITVTNGADTAEVYAYTVWHTSTVTTNEWVDEYGVTNIGTNTLWTPVSPPFNGIDSEWECLTTNLALSGGVGVYEDANIASNARVRFYAVANRLDSDGDGLTDGAEIFIHRTEPDNPDTDSDGMPDGWEIAYELDPLDDGQTARNNGASGDNDDDGYLNIYEYIHGTDPANPQSKPGISIYVDASSGPDGDGSAQAPFNTIQAALSAAADYEIISLAAGTYCGAGNVNLNYQGKPIMLKGADGVSVSTIDCQGISEYGVDFRTGEDNRSVLAHVRICHATRAAIRGIGLTFPTIQQSQIVSNQSAFQAWEGGGWLRNCEIVDNSADWSVISAGGDLYLENCVLARNSGSYEWDGVISFFGDRLNIMNCTIVNNSMYPIDIWSFTTNDIRICNSILWSNAFTLAQSYFFGGQVQYSCVQGGWEGQGNISSPPLLTRSRYRLSHNSPCIDAGSHTGMPTSDILGMPRWDSPIHSNNVSIYDMGAWEFTDEDSDGMDDGWEVLFGLDDANADPDTDGLTNLDEYHHGTDPNSEDTDGDMLGDGVEIAIYCTDPLSWDTDRDCLSDGDECFGDGTHGDTDGLVTNPFNVDTDGDGYADSPDCPHVGVCKAPDPRPTIWDGAYYSVQLSAESNTVTCGDAVRVSAQVVSTNDGSPIAGLFGLSLAVNSGGYFETNIVAGNMTEESLFPGVCYVQTDASGLFSADVRATDVGCMTFSAKEVGCGSFPPAPKSILAAAVPFRGAAWYGRWLKCLETQAVIQISLSALDTDIKGWTGGMGGWSLEDIEFNQITVGRDGYLLLGSQSAVTNYALALSNAPNGFLAPFFSNIHFKPDSRVYADVLWEMEPCFVAEWTHMGLEYDNQADLTFQAQVWLKSGNIRFSYLNMSDGTNNLADGRNALIGMKFSASNHSKWATAISNGFGAEWTTHSLPCIVSTCDDFDGDGLSAEDEALWGTDPMLWDTDGDGMSDGWEVSYSPLLDPLDPSDASEDPDGDQYVNIIEYYLGSDPTDADSPVPESQDSDHDGMPDAWEIAHGLDPYQAGDALLDPDHDWYVNLLEYALGGDPFDTYDHGLHPFEPNGGALSVAYPPDAQPRGASAQSLRGRSGNQGSAPAYGQASASGNSPKQNDSKGSLTVVVRQGGSADSATVEVGGQRWSVPAHRNADATNLFRLPRGESYTLTITRGTAISPPDDTVSLYWDIIPGSCVLLEGTTNAIINDGGDAIGAFSYIVEPVKLNMSRPDDKAASKYFHNSFDDSSPGICSVACIVEVKPNSSAVQAFVNNKVLWTMESLGGSVLTWQNGGAGSGLGIYDSAGDWREKAFFTSLPAGNDEFGVKNVEVSLDGLGSPQAGKTKIFFARDEKNHPGAGSGTTPNWYYYWSQTGASYGTHEYYGPGMDGNGRSYAGFINGQWRARIGDGVVKWNSSISGTTYSLGLNCFAFVTRHEERHRLDLIALWGATTDRDPLNDLDGDYLPDDQEAALIPGHPYNSNMTATYPDTYGYGVGWSDIEDYALRRQAYPTVDAYITSDWAYPGSQCGYGYTEY